MKKVQLHKRDMDLAAKSALLKQGVNPVLAGLWAARGIEHSAQVQPTLDALLPPTGLKGIDAAAALLASAIEQQHKVCVVADYDCDGATSCAVAVLGLRLLGLRHIDYIVPNRFKTGYGLTPEVVEQAAQHPRLGKPDIIVTVDNGIASVQGVEVANALGIRVLVTDHHLPGTDTPAAAAIVNPNQVGCEFASKHLAGVGVIFYVLLNLRALLRQKGVFTLSTQPKLDTLLDLVAVGTVADLVKLDANNRALVGAGLNRIRKAAQNGDLRPGLAALFAVAAKDARLARVTDIGFAIAPRLNAAGRLDDMGLGIECLLSTSMDQASAAAKLLNDINSARKDIESDMQISAEILTQAQLYSASQPPPVGLVLYHSTWHQGVVGLVASRIKDAHWRPTIAFAAHDDGTLRGSGRSIPGFHLRDALDSVSKLHPDLIQKFGGHAMAAGLTINKKDLTRFKAAFEKVCEHSLSEHTLERIVRTDQAPVATEIHVETVALLEAQVWGQGFEPPIFESEVIALEQRLLNQAHLKLKLDLGGIIIDAIWFGQTETLPSRLNVAYQLGLNYYKGNVTVQAIIEWATPLTSAKL